MQHNKALWVIGSVVLLVQLWNARESSGVTVHDRVSEVIFEPGANALAHLISQPYDVSIDAEYRLDHWGIVSFEPVPAYEIDTHDPTTQDVYISGSVHSSRIWDPYVWSKLVNILQDVPTGRTPVLVDVGANVGYFSLAAAALGARVIAFEPMSRNARKLSKSIIRNRFQDSVTLYQNAVWDTGASFPLRLVATSALNQGNGKVSHDSYAHGVYGVDFVNTISLSDAVNQDVDVMKIDTEGTEGAVIAGAKRLICGFRVKYVVMEFTDIKGRDDKYSAENMLRFMDAVGYAVSDVTPNAPSLSISDYMSFPPNILFSLKGNRAICD